MADRELGPGVYERDTVDGPELHVDAIEVCHALGVPATRENQQVVQAACVELARDEGIPEVEVREEDRLN